MLLLRWVYEKETNQSLNLVHKNVTEKKSIRTSANFNVNAQLTFLSGDNKPIRNDLKGTSSLEIDLSNGTIQIETLNLFSNHILFPQTKKAQRVLILLSDQYSSTGKVNLVDGRMDLSLNIKAILNRYRRNQSKLDLSIPLKGTMNKKDGVINLYGEITIPPRYFKAPLPVKIQVTATSKSKNNIR